MICFLGKRYNKLPTLFKDEQDTFDNILSSVEGGKLYSVKVVLGSKSFHRSFGLPSKWMASSGVDDGEDIPAGRAAPIVGDEGESHHSRGELCQDDHSRDGSV